MEKQIARWSYWLGVAFTCIALVWRGLSTFGALVPQPQAQLSIWYTSFYKAAALFLLVAIATANYAWMKSQKP